MFSAGRCVAVAALFFLALATHADVRGSAVTPDGRPVAGAKVELFAANVDELHQLLTGNENAPAATADTDAKGNFKLSAKPGNYTLSLTATGYAPAGTDTNGVEDLGGILLRPASMKRGRVTANGKPVANAVLRFVRNGRFRTTSGEDGTFSVPDPAVWSPTVTVTHRDYAPFHGVPSPPVGTLSLDIALDPGVTLRGRVVATDGESGAKAKLSIDGVAVGESGDDGAFTIERVPPKWRQLVATAGELSARVPREASLTLRLEPALTMRGTVVDAKSGMPIDAAVVTSHAANASSSVSQSTLTDAKGTFAIAALPPGSYRVAVSRSGYGVSGLPLNEQALTSATEPRTIRMQKMPRVSGTITDGERKPVGGVVVRAAQRGRDTPFGGLPPALASASDGRYTLRVHPVLTTLGDLDLIAIRNGFAVTKDGPHTLEPGEEKTINLVLDSGIALTGVVKSAAGDPLRGVAIASQELVNTRTVPHFPARWSELPTTDAQGRFTLQLRPGSYALLFRLPGFAPRQISELAVAAGVAALDVTLDPGATISGRVVTADGAPVPSLHVDASTDIPVPSVVTDANGAFTIHDLPAHIVRLDVAGPDGRSRSSRQVKAPTDNVLIELPPTVRVSGRVGAKGRGAVTDFSVGITPPREPGLGFSSGAHGKQVHDAEGRFVLETVPVGPGELQVTARGYVTARIPLRLERGKNVEDLEVTLERGATLRGRVTAENGAPLPMTSVDVRQGTENIVDPVTTDADGEYVVDSLPLGEQTIHFFKQGFRAATKSVTVDAGERRLDVQLSKGIAVAGRVVDDNGAPVADAEVFASSEQTDGGFGRAFSDASGRFRMEGLGSGVYLVRATRRGYAVTELTGVDISGTRELTITMSAGAIITGRVIGVEPSRVVEVRISAAGRTHSAQATADANGNFRMEGAPAGTVLLRAYVRSGSGSRSSEPVQLETQNGRSYTIDLEFREHNSVRGRVTRRGVPLRSGAVSFRPRTARDGASGPIDANGNYEVSGVRSGEHDVTVSDPNAHGAQYTTTHTITQSQTLDIDINPAALSGRVVNAATGEAIVGASIIVERAPQTQPIGATSATDGRVLIENITPGTYTLRVTKEEFGSYVAKQTFGEGATVSLDARLTPSAGLALRILDGRTNRPIQAWIVVHASDGSIPYNDRPRLRPDGTLLLPLAPGTYRINILPDGLSMSYVTATSPGTETVTLMPGGTLEISRPGFTRARILASDGSVYNVSLAGTTGEFRIMQGSGITDMAPGSYTLQLIGEDGRVTQSVPFTIHAGQTTRLQLGG